MRSDKRFGFHFIKDGICPIYIGWSNIYFAFEIELAILNCSFLICLGKRVR